VTNRVRRLVTIKVDNINSPDARACECECDLGAEGAGTEHRNATLAQSMKFRDPSLSFFG
jgi:hypothetical protein